MDGPDVSRLSPSDVAATLRSLPRRFTETLAPRPGDPPGVVVAECVGPGGESAAEITWHATSALALLGRALHQAVVESAPVLHPAVLDPTMRGWELPARTGASEALDHLGDVATGLADAVEGVGFGQWDRSVAVAGGGTTTPLDLAREAARSGAAALEAARRAMAGVRAPRPPGA